MTLGELLDICLSAKQSGIEYITLSMPKGSLSKSFPRGELLSQKIIDWVTVNNYSFPVKNLIKYINREIVK